VAKRINWSEKYELGLKENLSIKEIMMLRDCGQPRATDIRNRALKYCIENNIDCSLRSVPTEVVFKITNLDLEYYYNKMLQESKCLKYTEQTA